MRKDYHDYVIKDGKHIGDYEDLYKNIEDPWHQSQAQNNHLSYARNDVILHLKTLGIQSVVEVGCGLGYFASMIKKNIPGIDIVGIDISASAVKKARDRFTDIQFEIGNAQHLQKYSDYEAILFSGLMWYVLDDLDEILADLFKHFYGKYFINWMAFYEKGKQKYGEGYFTTLQELIQYIPFKVIKCTKNWENLAGGGYETTAVFKIEKKS